MLKLGALLVTCNCVVMRGVYTGLSGSCSDSIFRGERMLVGSLQEINCQRVEERTADLDLDSFIVNAGLN